MSGRAGSVASYRYNALGQRVAKDTFAGNTRFVYDEGGHLMGEYDTQGKLVQEIVWLDDLPVAAMRPKSSGTGMNVYYIHPDHLGTPRQITDSTNRIVWRWNNSDPFGANSPDWDPDRNGIRFEFNLRFPGQYYDGETGKYYNYFRDYDPGTGRYTTSDPIGLKGGSNRYTYVRGNPLSYIDPQGLAQQGVDPRELPRVPGEPRCSAGDASCAAGLPPTRPLTCAESCMIKEASLVCSPMAAGIGYVGGVVSGVGTQVVCRIIAYQICKDRCDQDKCNSKQ